MTGARSKGGWREATFEGAPRFTGEHLARMDGSSRTYEVHDAARGDRVWVKAAFHGGGELPEALVREYGTLAGLAHLAPHVPRIHELFEGDDETAFSLDRIEGTDLAHRPMRVQELLEFDGDGDTALAVGPVDEAAVTVVVEAAELRDADRLPLLGELVRVLDGVHRGGIVHRDVKPSHVIVTPEHRLVLIGFEMAAPTQDAWTPREGEMLGAQPFMAPEIVTGEGATPASDLYAVGVMLFEVLTGRLPFADGQTFLEALLGKVPPPAPSSVAPGVDPELDRLCAALLDPDPKQRPTAGEIQRALQLVLPH